MTQGFPPPPGSTIDDKFVVTELIGSGGSGVVVAARHRALGRLVAIKFLLPELAASAEIVERFLREARAISQLKSEHVVGIIDVGRLPNGIPYFVMEHLTGTDLSTLLQERGPFDVEDVLDYSLQALEAIVEAHRHGIVHRDLKPANLLLTTREDESAFIKVLDFGTSKLIGSELTLNESTSGSLLGSPLYMSPEQIRNAGTVDARSDIWSFGALMHELLTGHPPFQGRFLAEIMGSICNDDYALPAREDLPAELAEILIRCLQKDPEARFQYVEQLARAFSPIIGTVACQVSMERILRVPSSAPPPRPDSLIVELGAHHFSLSDTFRTPSMLPHATDPRDSSVSRPRRAWLSPLLLVALGAAGTATWLNLQSQPGGPAKAAPPAAAPAAVAPPAPAPAPSEAASSNTREHGSRAPNGRPRAPGKPQAMPKGAALVPQPALHASASGSKGSPIALPRRLDADNPFTN